MAKWPYSTAAWQRLRAAKLSIQPLCEVCIRREVVEPATVVDHVVAINAGGDPFPPLDGLMSMCTECHNIKTNAKDHPNATGFRRALKGYDVDGNPIDVEGWERTSEALGGDAEPAAFGSRRSTGQGPARETRKDLVSCDSFATSEKEGDLWV
ncbi:HNH endonuclease signature motif containing protein [Rhizobium etli]|nr:HNH endonuclease signature motif containing protein [Rhizobium etli]